MGLEFKDITDWTPSTISIVDVPYHPLAYFEVYENDEEFVKYMPDDVEERLFMNSYIQKGYDQGIERGIEKGIERGIEKGIEQGIEQGIKQNNIEIAKKMLQENTDINFISKITGLSYEEIGKIKEEC